MGILTPYSSSHFVPLAAHEIDAPTSPAKSACSYIVTWCPACRKFVAVARPPLSDLHISYQK